MFQAKRVVTEQTTQAANAIPERSPPKTTKEVIQQTRNTRALRPQKLFRPFINKNKITTREKGNEKENTTHSQLKTKPQGKMSP